MLIVRARRELRNEAAARLEAIGESFWDYQTLSRLIRHGAMSQGDLAAATAQHPATVSRILVELERRGLIRRRRDSEDRRRVLVDITAKGKRAHGRMKPPVVAAIVDFLSPLDVAEQRAMFRLLEKVVRSSAW